MVIKTNKPYLAAALVLLVIEVLIALFVNDSFIRPFLGDFLATMLVYSSLRFLSLSKKRSFLLALLISFFLEGLQLVNFLDWSGLGQYRLLRILLGTSFSVADLWAYTLGGVVAFSIDLSCEIKEEKENPVRKVWANPDAVLLIFAGASAEFALSKYVDWLFFTGKIPNQPVERMMSTLAYARKLLLAGADERGRALRELVRIHEQVGERRGFYIPNEAFREVLNLLIFYTEKSHHLLFGSLDMEGKNLIISEFKLIGRGMHIEELPENWQEFEKQRNDAIRENYACSDLTKELLDSYRRNLGEWYYRVLVRVYHILLPARLCRKMPGDRPLGKGIVQVILFFRKTLIRTSVLYLLLPARMRKGFDTLFGQSLSGIKTKDDSHFRYLYRPNQLTA